MKNSNVMEILCISFKSLLLFRMVHGFTSSGMIESQYQGFTQASKIGRLGDKYIDNGKVT